MSEKVSIRHKTLLLYVDHFVKQTKTQVHTYIGLPASALRQLLFAFDPYNHNTAYVAC